MPYVSEEVRLPYSAIDVGNGEQIEETDLMEFRLLYDGELPSTGNKGKPFEVHAIRRIFHPQLRRLWNAERNLRELAKMSCNPGKAEASGMVLPLTDNEMFDFGIKTISTVWSRVGFDWVPLVTPKIALRCSIDVLLLRPEIEEKYVLRRGDIDGQIKTLFDALRIPANTEETGGATPQSDETPFFCLLEDDRLITEVRVATDRLLLLPNKKEVKPNDCLAVIHVRVNHKNPGTFDNYFG